MAESSAFNAQGNLTAILAAVAANPPAPVQLFAPSSSQMNAGVIAYEDIEVTNTISGVDAFLVHASTSAGANTIAAAGIPIAPASQIGMIHIPAGTDKIYALRSDEWYTAITAAGTASLFLLPGRGV